MRQRLFLHEESADFAANLPLYRTKQSCFCVLHPVMRKDIIYLSDSKNSNGSTSKEEQT